MREPFRVWFLAPEVAPFAKTGGLADVAGSLPGALRSLGVDVRVGLPCYRMVKEGAFPTRKAAEGLEVSMGGRRFQGDVLETVREDGVPVYLFDQKAFFDRQHLYGTPEGDYPDNLERFAYFCLAALFFAQKSGFRFDLVHCHDWQTGLIPVYLKTLFQRDPFFFSAASVFTVHNMGYQGLFPTEGLSTCDVPPSAFHPEGLEYWGQISLLKAGLVYADAVTTVSKKYSQEIQTPEFGLGMDAILRNRSDQLYGILNGADYRTWDPARDPHIRAHYSAGSLEGKGLCKAALVHEMGLGQRFLDRPVLAVISRLAAQKGHDLLFQIVEDLVERDAGLVVLGAGEQRYEEALSRLGTRYGTRVGFKIGFDESLAHRIMAGADMLLVPSQYEPCGLTQIYALKYGTVPIVRATGGLDDTVEEYDASSGKGTGFKFVDYRAEDLLEQVMKALEVYKDQGAWERLVKNGMAADFSWQESARQYVGLYEKLTKGEGKDSIPGETV